MEVIVPIEHLARSLKVKNEVRRKNPAHLFYDNRMLSLYGVIYR